MTINIKKILLGQQDSRYINVSNRTRRFQRRDISNIQIDNQNRILTKEDIYKSLEKAYKHASMAR